MSGRTPGLISVTAPVLNEEEILETYGRSMSPEDQDKLVEFAACMREHGIEMPDPQTASGGGAVRIGGDGIDPGSPEFQDSMEACQELMPGGGPGGDGGPSVNQSGG